MQKKKIIIYYLFIFLHLLYTSPQHYHYTYDLNIHFYDGAKNPLVEALKEAGCFDKTYKHIIKIDHATQSSYKKKFADFFYKMAIIGGATYICVYQYKRYKAWQKIHRLIKEIINYNENIKKILTGKESLFQTKYTFKLFGKSFYPQYLISCLPFLKMNHNDTESAKLAERLIIIKNIFYELKKDSIFKEIFATTKENNMDIRDIYFIIEKILLYEYDFMT